MINRRSLITGLVSFAAAPAIVRAANLMPVKVVKQLTPEEMINIILEPYFADVQKRIEDLIMYGQTFYNHDGRIVIETIHSNDYYLPPFNKE